MIDATDRLPDEGAPDPAAQQREIDALKARLEALTGSAWHAGDAEQSLRAQQALLRTVLDESPDYIVLKDHEGNFLLCNQPVADFYGTTPEAMVGKHDGHFSATAEQAEFFRQNVLGIMARGRTEVVIEESTDDRTGEKRWFKSIKKPFFAENGQPRILVIAHDITDVRRAQQQVQESERRLSYVLNATGEGVWDWDLRTNTLQHNQRWYEMLGFEKSSLTGTVKDFEDCLFEEDRPAIGAALQQSLEGHGAYRHEHRMRRQDGSVIWVLDRGDVVERDAQGRPLRMVGSFSDITERKALEDELRERTRQAEAANQTKSEFLAAISHELRTPLTSIRGYAELMEHRLEHPRFRESAGLIRKGAEHLNELLTQILDLAKVEAGAMPVNLASVALRPVLQGTLDFFELTARAKGLELALKIAADVPQQFTCDDLRLKQVLNNLLSNALKFTTQGSVRIELERCGAELCFHVVDTGPGIPAELHETVFEKFRQANGRVAYEHGGTGLGLALSRGLAELMGGSLTLQSAPGQGCRFTLTLPV